MLKPDPTTDLCVSAALAAVKEMVPIPWTAGKKAIASGSSAASTSQSSPEPNLLKVEDEAQRDDQLFKESVEPVISTSERSKSPRTRLRVPVAY